MEDSSLLERMGRELKCPICLSLLSSAASLSCNHVFCNLCIRESMKSGLCCPVCKVPYQRREVRPAPHMDNLVNVYKSMEAATGINTLVTQTVLAINSSDGEKPSRDESNHRTERIKEPCKGKRKRTSKKKQLTKISKLNAENSGRNSQPSIAANKRVQVPQYPLQETPMKPTISKIDKIEAVNHISHTSLSEDGEPCFPPFFWLREKEDMDKSSQETDVDFVSDLSPVNVPTFSDIKDSDDEAPSKSSPKENLQSKFNGGNYFDSELFQWSQRACSPDLLSSPVKMQVGDTKKSDDIFKGISKLNEATNEGKAREAPGCLTHCSRKRNIISYDVGHPSGSKRSRKRNLNNSKRGDDLHSKQIVPQVSGISLKGSVDKCRQKQCGESIVGARTSETDGSPESLGYVSAEANLPNEIEENEAAKESVSCAEHVKREEKILVTGARNSLISHCMNRRTRKRKQAAKDNKIEKEVAPTLSKGNETKALERSKSFQRSKSGNENIDSELQPRGRVKPLDNCILLDGARADLQGVEVPLVAETMGRVQEISDPGNVDSVATARNDPKLGYQTLRKCDASSSRAQCAFCCSTEETEASGEIVHYSKGTQVSADYEGGSNIIHSHKSCAEWAPNVYFEGDVAVNLEAELARSRRIKCCLCGVKGAALGCFQNSCRKSFHVPCAKMVSQCLWDEENFVMLCPLHSSSKLPCEMSGSQAKQRKCDQNRRYRPERSQADAKQHTQSSPWDSRSPSTKLVVCCSGLTKQEKEGVSAFQRMSRSTVSKQWSPNVTHVITSTDENGACRRTLKVLMGILEGKWIVNAEWIKACIQEKRLVDEASYEVNKDIHGIMNGPQRGRLRLLNKKPKLFAGIAFYLSGDFLPAYKGYIQDLIAAAGGTVLHRRPISLIDYVSSDTSVLTNIIVYNLELPANCHPNKRDRILKDRQIEAEALALLTGFKVATNVWILNCIAGYKLLDLEH